MNDSNIKPRVAGAEKQCFKATRLPDIDLTLAKAYGQEKGSEIFSAAEKILYSELSAVDDRGSKMIGKHIRRNILPGYACYRAMLDYGISNSEAIEFVKVELCKSAERMVRLSRMLGSKKHVFGLFRLMMKIVLSYAYPKQGWTMNVLEDSKERYRFDMTSCLYCEELKKRGALELCPAFCYTDVVSYSPLAPAILFIRQDTLANTGVKCDFCFERGEKQ